MDVIRAVPSRANSHCPAVAEVVTVSDRKPTTPMRGKPGVCSGRLVCGGDAELRFLQKHLHSGSLSAFHSTCGTGRQAVSGYADAFAAWNASYGALWLGAHQDKNGSSVLVPPYSSISCSGPCPCSPSGRWTYNDVAEEMQMTERGRVEGKFAVLSGQAHAVNGSASSCQWLIASRALINLSFVSFEFFSEYDLVQVNRCESADCSWPHEIARLSSIAPPGSTSFVSTAGFLQVALTVSRYTGIFWRAPAFEAAWHVNTINGAYHAPPSRCASCAAETYKNQTNDADCVACPAHSSTPRPGAIYMHQCQCNAGYFSLAELSSNVSCHKCPAGYSCAGDQSRQPCPRGTFSGAGASQCSLCPAGKYKNTTGSQDSGACVRCGLYMESKAGSDVCTCLAGFTGPPGGPCLCLASSTRNLRLSIETSAVGHFDAEDLFATKSIVLRVYNVSNGTQMLCGADSVACEPFLVYYTLDGSLPHRAASRRPDVNTTQTPAATTTTYLACEGWRADACARQWLQPMNRTGFAVRLFGDNVIRAVVMRQGLHQDTCLDMQGNVSEAEAAMRDMGAWQVYDTRMDESAALVCNVPQQLAAHAVSVAPDVPLVQIFSINGPAAAAAQEAHHQNLRGAAHEHNANGFEASAGRAVPAGDTSDCACASRFCCTRGLGDTLGLANARGLADGVLYVALRYPRLALAASRHSEEGRTVELRYSFCEAPLPAGLNGTTCAPSVSESRKYTGPLGFTTRCFVRVFARYYSSGYTRTGPGRAPSNISRYVDGEAVTFQVPVVNYVTMQPAADNLIRPDRVASESARHRDPHRTRAHERIAAGTVLLLPVSCSGAHA